MTDDYKEQEINTLITQVDEDIATDKIIDLKNGIYNLFVSLFNYYVIDFGPIQAVELSTQFLDEISNNFKQILNKTQDKEQL